MEQTVSAIAERVLERLHRAPADQRVLVGIAGVPGSGKSTLAYPLVDRLNALLGVAVKEPAEVDLEDVVAQPGKEKPEDQVAVAVGLDGWHHTREALDRFPDPSEARRRRGAAFTFDAPSYVSFVRSLRQTPSPPSIPFPTFDHALKDPLPSRFPILPTHRIVVIEGLYCMLDVAPWREAAELLDERIWVEIERGVARERLVKRHLRTGVETEREEAEKRVDLSDMLNGDYIRENLYAPTQVVETVDDPAFASAAVC
ncbi:kinase-related protein [Rhodotorula toruloides]|uniref:Kinase-related protein n=1 Tax=Rhodotorula toruloides TaxID=5286 RepID=A0A511KA43_RHOTO|nr:kinase-related protein [Rhodotorula toruloides]